MEFNPELIQQFLSEVDFQAQGTTYIVNENDTVVADSNGSLSMRPAGLNLPIAKRIFNRQGRWQRSNGRLWSIKNQWLEACGYGTDSKFG